MKIILKYIRIFINRLGYDIVRYRNPIEANLILSENLGYELETKASDLIQIVKDNTMLSKRRLVTLHQQTVYCEENNIPGAFCECGVWKGGAVGLMALTNLKTSSTRRDLHLFDAFQEICEPNFEIDGDRALMDVENLTGRSGENKGRLQPLKGIYDKFGGPGTIEENKNLLENVISYPLEYINYHIGWFQDTLPKVHSEIKEIAILRLDGDWYASTKICLDYLFDKVVDGGVVIIDDYGTYEGCRRAVDEFMQAKGYKYFLHSIDSEARYLIKT